MVTEEPIAAVADQARRPTVHLVLNWWTLLPLALASLLPWLLIAALLASRNATSGKSNSSRGDENAGQSDGPTSAADRAATWSPADRLPQEWVAGKKGPWGQIESMVFALDVPDEFLLLPAPNQPPIRWSFPGHSKEQVLATLHAVGMPEEDIKKLNDSAPWSNADGVTAVEPGDPLILSLAPEVRAKLYAILAAFPQNAPHVDPVWFRPEGTDWRWEDSGLAAESIALLKRLLYPQGEHALLFADFEPALRSLPSDAERRRFMKVLSRKRCVLAKLRIEPDMDVEQLARYWGIGGRRKDIFPFLNALHRVEQGCTLNIVCLLPDFARDHLYSHPFAAADDTMVKQDAFWSAFNFFNDPPDNHFSEMEYVKEVLVRDYYEIEGPSQLGDLIFVTADNKNVVHVAAYVADDLVFTKNGDDFRQPWLLMHIASMMETFAVKHPNGPLKQQFYRKKSL
jgi:hypothetical protein